MVGKVTQEKSKAVPGKILGNIFEPPPPHHAGS